MNIFALSHSPIVSAQMQHDKHVVKMVLESAQMLCSTFDPNLYDVPYKRVHYNHPCTKWARENIGNFFWLVNHGLALASEYTYRYGKVHCLRKLSSGVRKIYLAQIYQNIQRLHRSLKPCPTSIKTNILC